MTITKKAKFSALTYIDRDSAAWKVEPGTHDETQPVIRIMVTEAGEDPKVVVFHADDADMLIALIEQARDK
jgi:hypothetical protein